jgi:hypothetical protein
MNGANSPFEPLGSGYDLKAGEFVTWHAALVEAGGGLDGDVPYPAP